MNYRRLAKIRERVKISRSWSGRSVAEQDRQDLLDMLDEDALVKKLFDGFMAQGQLDMETEALRHDGPAE